MPVLSGEFFIFKEEYPMFISIPTIIVTTVIIATIMIANSVEIFVATKRSTQKFINDCHAMLDERYRTIERLESELQMYELVEREYLSEIARLNDTISELHKELHKKEIQIEELRAERDEYYKLVDEYTDPCTHDVIDNDLPF